MPIQQTSGVTADPADVNPDTGEVENRRPAPAGQTRDDYHAKDRAAFLAGADADDDDTVGEPAEPVKPKKIIGAPVDDDDDEPAAPADDSADDEDDDDEEEVAAPVDDDDEEHDDEEGDDDGTAADEAVDPELAKRMAIVRKTEQRKRQAFEREKSEFVRERSEWQAQTKQVAEAQKRFEQLAGRVRYNPTAVLLELGLTADDLEGAAQEIIAHSPKYAAKPEYRAAAERAMREREAADKAARAEERVAKLEQTIEHREQEAAIARDTEAYVGRVLRKADDTSPLTKQLIAKNPAKAKAELARTAFTLAQKLGQLPKAGAVIAAHEKRLVRELADLGIEPPAAVAAAPAKPGAKIVAPAIKAKPAAKPAPVDPDADIEPERVNGRVVLPSREQVLKELEALS